MMEISKFAIDPPLLNSASPWATTVEDIRALYDCEHTGAITIRTALLEGFPHDDKVHQYTFFDPSIETGMNPVANLNLNPDLSSSLNTLGYSPFPLKYYLEKLRLAAQGNSLAFTCRKEKPIIVSVAGTSEEVVECYQQIAGLQDDHKHTITLMMEINLSCPNIPGESPPAYDGPSLALYLRALAVRKAEVRVEWGGSVDVLCGIKTPPYTFSAQYETLISELEASAAHSTGAGCPIAFITATNTLGSCLLLHPSPTSTTHTVSYTPTLASSSSALETSMSTGIGGLAGSALHPLSLGNVCTLRKALDSSIHPSIQAIKIIGTGGVSDAQGAARMRAVGATAVGVGTALGRLGVGVFERIRTGSLAT